MHPGGFMDFCGKDVYFNTTGGGIMQKIFTAKAPRPIGHYSQAIVHHGIVYVSGQLPIDPETGDKVPGGIEDQTLQALKNISEILKAAGSDILNTVKVTVYISDIELWQRVNAVYADFFGDHKPARAVVPTRNLHYGFLIEIDAIATLTDKHE